MIMFNKKMIKINGIFIDGLAINLEVQFIARAENDRWQLSFLKMFSLNSVNSGTIFLKN